MLNVTLLLVVTLVGISPVKVRVFGDTEYVRYELPVVQEVDAPYSVFVNVPSSAATDV